jgi:type II secretion system protein G
MPTEVDLHILRSAVRQAKMDSGRLPTEEEGLDMLVRRPADWPDAAPWTPYLDSLEPPRDAWGNVYAYVLDANLPGGFGIYSCGRDGVISSNGNDLDDLNTWNRARPWAAYYAKQMRRVQIRRSAMPFAVALLVAGGIIARAWAGSGPAHRVL